jgi:hypothetical protein
MEDTKKKKQASHVPRTIMIRCTSVSCAQAERVVAGSDVGPEDAQAVVVVGPAVVVDAGAAVVSGGAPVVVSGLVLEGGSVGPAVVVDPGVVGAAVVVAAVVVGVGVVGVGVVIVVVVVVDTVPSGRADTLKCQLVLKPAD